MIKNQVFNNFHTPSSTQINVQLIVNKLVAYFRERIDTVIDTLKINNGISGLRKEIFINLRIPSSTQIKKP